MDFIDDDKKMRDFFLLTKDEFLDRYKYLSENDYDVTRELVKSKRIIELLYIGNDSNNLPVYRSNGGYIYKDISLGENNNLKSGITMIILVVTIVVAIILLLTVTVAAKNIYDNTVKSNFATDMTLLEDAVKTYYKANKKKDFIT